MILRQPDGRWFNDIRFNINSKASEKILKDVKNRNKIKFNKYFTSVYILDKVKKITVGTALDNDIILNSRKKLKLGTNPKYYFIIFKKWNNWKIKNISKTSCIKIHNFIYNRPKKLKFKEVEKLRNGTMLTLEDETHLFIEKHLFEK